MHFPRRPRLARVLPTAALMAFLVGLVTLMLVLPGGSPGTGEAHGGDPPTSCGVERWSVKTGTDADAHQVDLHQVLPASVFDMGRWSRPGSLPPNNRVPPYEFQVRRVEATLVEFKLESDRDYHLVLADDRGHTMVAEIPDPACVGANSVFADYIANARAQFNAVYHVTTSFQYAYVPVTVTGVAFFDFAHGQTGRAPNIIELHPVLDIQFQEPGPFAPAVPQRAP